MLGPASRPVAIPDDIDDPSLIKATGIVQLPLHIAWSEPTLTYDLNGRSDRHRVYEQVLREGTDDDVRYYARIVTELAEAKELALANGAALIVRGDVDRRTRDLNFFDPSAIAVNELLPATEQALLGDGLQVERIIDHPGLARLLVGDTTDQTEVDLGSDARLLPVEGVGRRHSYSNSPELQERLAHLGFTGGDPV